MRYITATVICAVGAITGAIVLFIANAPAHSPGYGKALPLVLPVLSALVFGVVWFPTVLTLFLLQRFGSRHALIRRPPPVVLLVVSALAFIPASYHFGSSVYEELQRRRFVELAGRSAISLTEFGPFIDAYSAQTRRGLFSGGRKDEVLFTLLRNRSTPQEVLQRLADSLDDSCNLWSEIAAHPNLPRPVVDRCLRVPTIAPSLARNPEAFPEFLAYLSTLPNRGVKTCVARNLNTPRPTLERLAKEGILFARENLEGRLDNFAWR